MNVSIIKNYHKTDLEVEEMRIRQKKNDKLKFLVRKN